MSHECSCPLLRSAPEGSSYSSYRSHVLRELLDLCGDLRLEVAHAVGHLLQELAVTL